MKTKDAFALCYFDEKRILQRPYFRSFNLPVATDTEILKMYDVTNCSNRATMKKTLSALRGLQKPLAAYTKKLFSHEFILEKFMRYYSEMYIQTSAQVFKEKYDRAHILQQSYCVAIGFLGQLQSNTNRVLWAGEKIFDEKYRKGFGERLRQARKTAGLTQAELAERVGLKTYNAIAQYERGINDPSLPTLFRLATTLNVKTDWLLGLN